MTRIDLHVAGANVFIAVKHLLECFTAIERSKHTALLVRPVWMPSHGHEKPVGIFRVDSELRDLLTVAQSQMRPRLASISRFVNAIPDRKIRAMQSFTAADVNDVRIYRRNRDRADRCRRLIVKNRLPCPAVVGGFKNAAVHRRHVEDIRLRRNACDRASASTAMRSDVPPAQNGIEIFGPRLANAENDDKRNRDYVSNRMLLHWTLDVERSAFSAYFPNASLFTTYGILVGSPS